MVKQKKSKYALSFNAQLFAKNTVEIYGPTKSGSIFTWQQALAKENWTNLRDLLKGHYDSRESVKQWITLFHSSTNLRTMDTIVTLYYLRDEKMIYILTQHSMYNRKGHPNILCKCWKNEGSLEQHGIHKCVIIIDEESITLYNTSKEH